MRQDKCWCEEKKKESFIHFLLFLMSNEWGQWWAHATAARLVHHTVTTCEIRLKTLPLDLCGKLAHAEQCSGDVRNKPTKKKYKLHKTCGYKFEGSNDMHSGYLLLCANLWQCGWLAMPCASAHRRTASMTYTSQTSIRCNAVGCLLHLCNACSPQLK